MTEIVRLDRVDLRHSRKPWRFAQERRAEIAVHFEAAKQKRPLWDGRILMLDEFELSGSAFRGVFLETDFSALLAWRDWGWPDQSIRNCFAQAALRGSDGAFVMGLMSTQTANAGQVYFPSGSPDRNDIVDDTVDLDRSVARELKEETGLDVADFDLDPGWYAVHQPPRIAMMKIMQAREPAEALKARILDFLSREDNPELADVIVTTGTHDIDARTQPYAVSFLRHIWRA